ncbi:hypothetical protein PINS_up000772 [Pythium insidiosum]|nr:hypothetical protein PINS_up000772 [Pythium insidiosum]
MSTTMSAPPHQLLVETSSKTLHLPRPFLHEPNRCFQQIEDWSSLVAQVATQSIHVKPLGYYRTPDAVDIYVFECALGDSNSDKKTWKIYRRYSQFQRYVAHSTDMLSMMAVPKLSQAYMKLFAAKSCKDRLVELHAWLVGVIENTQTFCAQRQVLVDDGQPVLSALDAPDAVPALILASFLLAGANHPFPHVFRGIPSFALALEEINLQLTKAPVYPSKLRSSVETHAGLGLRLAASHEQQGTYVGAMVSGFLRDVSELDKQLAQVNVGSKLVRINGVDVTDEPFDKVLIHLRNAGLPLRLRFVYNPHLHRRARGRSVLVRGGDLSSLGPGMSEKHRRDSAVSSDRDSFSATAMTPTSLSSTTSSSTASAIDVSVRNRQVGVGQGNNNAARPPSGSATAAELSSLKRRGYTVDTRRSMGLFGSVFSDLFGARKRGETTDLMFDNQLEEIFSWDDIGGDFQDIISRGFFTYLSQAMLLELRRRRESLVGDSIMDRHDAEADEAAVKALEKRKGHGVWSTATGPMGLSFGSCKLRDVEAAMLEVPPVFFSSRLGHLGVEKRLSKGFVIVSINNESTFGLSFSAVMRMLARASRPTSVCFRWFKDYSPFLETELAEQDTTGDRRSTSNSNSSRLNVMNAFESSMDCVSEAQTDLCSSLHLALVENASIRNEISALHDTNRELRQQQELAAKAQAALEAQLQEQRERIGELMKEVADCQVELRQTKQQLRHADERLAGVKDEYQKMVERAHANAVQKIAEHEERLVKESNRSIENAKVLAERKMQKELDAALADMQRKHDEYLQKLAEEHSEEVESLTQQVAVWRHQVEVLTEAEKRTYAAMINNGTNPYQDYTRTRFGYADSSPYSNGSSRTYRASEKGYAFQGGNGGVSSRSGGTAAGTSGFRHSGGNQRDDASGSPEWRDTASPGGFKDHGSSEFSDRSSLSNNNGNAGTIWDRMVSLISN